MASVVTRDTLEISPFDCYTFLSHGMVLSVAVATVALGILTILAEQRIIQVGSLADLGITGGSIFVGIGGLGLCIDLTILLHLRSVPIQIPKQTEKIQAVQKEIACAKRFVHGQQDKRNPLWDTVEELSMMTWRMGAFHHIEPLPDQMDQLWTEFTGMPTGQLSLMWCGHASFFLQTAKGSILFDPNFDSDIPFLGPIKSYYRSVPPPCSLDALPAVDQILISHTHADHFSTSTLTHFKNTPICCPSHVETLLEGFTQVTAMTWWQKVTVLEDIEITFLPSDHASQTNATNCNEFLWGGYKLVIPLADGKKYRIWFTGDSACNINPGIRGFKSPQAAFDKAVFTQIAEEFKEGIDLILYQTDPPYGQEDKHWNVWQGLDMLTRLFEPYFNSGTKIVPMHWGTWSFDGFGRDLLAPLTIMQNVYHDLNPQMAARLMPMKVGETKLLVT